MSIEARRWLMTAVKAPLERATFTAEPGAGEVVVAIAGCGVCHTDLGYYYDGVRTNHPLPLALGHEISGHVVAAGPGAEHWLRKAVIVPAVLPCGECDLCRRGLAPICRTQKMPGNDIHGGFASHIVVPGRGLCEVDEKRLAKAGLTLADVSIVADALTTPYQAVRRAGVKPGSLAIVVGAGGVGGYCVQVAKAFGATVVAIDVDEDKLEAISHHGAALTLDARALDGKAMKVAINAFAKRNGLPDDGVDHLRMLGNRSRAAHRIRPARPRRDALRRRLHDGQDRDPPLQSHGLRRARARQLGLPRPSPIRRRSISFSTARSRSNRSSRRIRSTTSTASSPRSTTAKSKSAWSSRPRTDRGSHERTRPHRPPRIQEPRPRRRLRQARRPL